MGRRRPVGRAAARSTPQRAPRFLATALPGLDPASGPLRAAPRRPRRLGRRWPRPHRDAAACWCSTAAASAASHLAGRYDATGRLEVLAAQALPHSLGLLYEELTAHLGFLRSSDEYKVMALASYGTPRFLDELRELVRTTGDGGFRTEPVDWSALRQPRGARRGRGPPTHADLAASVQAAWRRCCSSSPRWLHDRTGDRALDAWPAASRSTAWPTPGCWREGPFERRLGAAGRRRRRARRSAPRCTSRASAGDAAAPMPTRRARPRLGRRRARGLAAHARRRRRSSGRTTSPTAVADGAGRRRRRRLVPGPQRVRPARARPPLAAGPPGRAENLERLNDVKGREQFRPVAPMVLAERAAEIFTTGRCPSRTCCSCTTCARSGATGSRPSCTSTAPRGSRPSTAPTSRWSRGCSRRFEARTGLPVRGQHQPQHRRAGRWSTTRATRWSASARRRSTLLAIGPFVVRRPRPAPTRRLTADAEPA